MKDNVAINLFWRFMERIGAQIVSFAVSVILARILMPEVYGTVALVTVITTILQVFVDSGMGNALIQKADADTLDFSTVFYFNIVMCVGLYGLLCAAAPYIARFYEQPELTPIIRVLGLILVISGIKNVQQAYVSRHMLFKKFFFATLGGTITAAVVGIYMAVAGYGVWALVAQHLTNLCIDTVVLWVTVQWRPIAAFSWKRWKLLFSYGWKLLASAVLETGYSQLRQLLIGKFYSASDLAFYNRGQQLPNLVVTNINTSIDSVLLPTMSASQDDPAAVKSMTRRAIKTSSFLMWPMMVGLGVCAEPLIRILLTEKWIFCVPYLRIFCFSYAFYPIHTSNLNAIKAMGRSDIFLKLEIIKKGIGILILLLTMRHGVMVMAYSLLLTTVISSIVNAYPNKKLLHYSYLEQMRDILPSILLAAVMGAAVYAVQFFRFNDFVTLVIQIPVGMIFYAVGAKTLKFESYTYIMGVIKKFSRKH